MKSVIIKIRETDLNDAGRQFINLVRQQNRHLSAILTPRNGIIYAELNNENTDDILRVVVDDTIGHAERIRRFGQAGRSHATPEQQETMYEMHAMTPAARRLWFVPEPLIKRAAADPEFGATIINLAAEALGGWCAEGCFIPWRDSDWVSQSIAADAVGVSVSIINNAVRTGALNTWNDLDEPNPQRRTRVRLSEVKRKWQR